VESITDLAIQGEYLHDLLGVLLGVVDADQAWVLAKDLGGEAKAHRIWATVCWQEMTAMAKRVEAMAEALSRSHDGAVEAIELQEMTEDE